MLLKIIALAISLLGLSEVENITHDKAGSSETVVIILKNGSITIHRNPELLMATNTTMMNSWTNYRAVPMPFSVPRLATPLPDFTPN